jgi:hypothetical protein
MDNHRLFISYQLLGTDRRWHFINSRTINVIDISSEGVLKYLRHNHSGKEVILNFAIEITNENKSLFNIREKRNTVRADQL